MGWSQTHLLSKMDVAAVKSHFEESNGSFGKLNVVRRASLLEKLRTPHRMATAALSPIFAKWRPYFTQ